MKKIIVLIAFALLLAVALPVLAKDKAPAASPVTAVANQAKAALLDINTATEAELKSLPGIGEAFSKKIIAGRPYASKDQLKSRGIIPDALYDKIKDLIIAKQAK